MSELRDQLQKTLGGSYALERELGGGGMSRVFVAEETSLGRKVVVKVLPPDLAAAVNLERFRREIQLAAKLQHPHIVPVLAAGVSEGLPYYTMPFIEGETLRAKIAQVGPLPINETVKVLRDTLSALSYAHEHGVVHRDIKPENILIADEHAVVADFGVAKAISASTNSASSLTSLGVALGTPAYMSPEQAAADPATDHRSDLYSVGAVAYEMLSGQSMFPGRSPQAMLAAQAMEAPEPIEKRRPSVPTGLAALVMRALQKYPADRPQTAREMLAELDAAITPSNATTPYTGMMPARKVVSSSRSMWMSIVGAAMLLVLGSSTWYWYKHKQPVVAVDGSTSDSTASLAVLPFENLGKTDDAYFADGMTEEISSRLGELSGLRVIGRQSVRGYANSNKTISQIGKELGVGYVLTGSVRWDKSVPGKSRVRVSPALLRTSDGSQVWSEPYEDEVSGVFQIQSKVAQRVADAMKIQLNRGERQTLDKRPTDNVEAYDYYLRSQTLEDRAVTAGDRLKGVALAQKAVELDPNFAAAWAQLGDAHMDAFWYGMDPTPNRLTLARKAIDRALSLAPNEPRAHVALGFYYYHGKLDYSRALDEFAAALRLAPNNAYAASAKGTVERRQNNWAEAVTDLRRAVSLDPRNTGYLNTLSETLLFNHSYAESESVARQLIAIEPSQFSGYGQAALARMVGYGDATGALAVLREAHPQMAASDFAEGLLGTSLIKRYGWPLSLDPALAGIVKAYSPSKNEGDRLNYYSARLELATYEKDASARAAFADSVLTLAPRLMKGGFVDADIHIALAYAYAAKAERERALREAQLALDLVPLSRDAIRPIVSLDGRARIAAYLGDIDIAVASLRETLGRASTVSVPLLRADPWFNSIRNDPRFQRLLEVQ